jgi:hypothetical protein
MAAPNRPSGFNWKDWLPVITVAALLISAMLSGGGYISQLQDNTRRIGAIEAKSDGRDDKLNTIDVRTARIEAKLELLTTDEKVHRP